MGKVFRAPLRVLALIWLLAIYASAQSTYAPLFKYDFTEIAQQGFGERQNTWAWSMAYFNGKLYLGTNRSEDCITQATSHMVDPATPYPPLDPDISCPVVNNPDGSLNFQASLAQLSLQAEIWAWDPKTNSWSRVFQSPLSVAVPGTNPLGGTTPLMVPPDIGFRGMMVYTEADGTQALYVGGCSSTEIHPGVPGGRLLRSVDGVNFTPIPQDPGTNLAAVGNTCFRGMQSFLVNNQTQFVALAVNWKGEGTVIMSPTPKLGDNTFNQISSPLTPAYEIGVFNNFLYVTFVDNVHGFNVQKTNAVMPAPNQLPSYSLVIPNGGCRPVDPDPIALSMSNYDGDLYVGGDGVQRGQPVYNQSAELFRIHADDTWDVISGDPRPAGSCSGAKNPLSGLTGGFGWYFNEHMWRQNVYDGRLYVGTFDDSTAFRLNKDASAFAAEEGFDLWWTQDGTYFNQVNEDGFGDKFNIGVRSFANTPYGMFLGTANPFYGLRVYKGFPSQMVNGGPVSGSTILTSHMETPQHVQVEAGASAALLSWDPPASGAKQYHIFRKTFTAVAPGEEPSAAVPTAWAEIAATANPVYRDGSVEKNGKYAYQIKAEDENGQLSGYSNFVTYPAAGLPVTFGDVRDAFSQRVQHGNFGSVSGHQKFWNRLTAAEKAAASGNFDSLNAFWATVKTDASQYSADSVASRELELMLSRLSKRGQLVQAGYLTPDALRANTTTTPNSLVCSNGNCVQPTNGPGGSTYPFGSITINGPYWANNRYTDDNFKYFIYEPAQPTPAQAPVILFLHGYGAFAPSNYEGWLEQMCRKGYTVVWVEYQAHLNLGNIKEAQSYPSNAQATWVDALYRLQNFTWEKHVKPAQANGQIQSIFVGHSFGGWIAPSIAGNATTALRFPPPLAVVMIEPASLGLLPPINYAGISANTKMVIVSGDQDTTACTADAVSIYTNSPPQAPQNKQYLFYNSDTSGTPQQIGNHFFPNTDGYSDTASMDMRDYEVTWKLSVAAADCVVSNQNCDYFLGAGSANQLFTGTWSNGVNMKPMTYITDPTTQLPHIPGCP